MSKQVDEKVVSMQFDNKNFENNVKTSMSTLDKLKDSLKFSGATKGLEDVSNAAAGVKINPLGQAAEAVAMKFSGLQVAAITTLVRITNAALTAGKNLVSAFTIDPIRTGLAEYETQINAVQTILANTSSKGTTLDQVNKALDELNHYADMTIYNFTEMTRNIGTFTAAGVDLDTSVSAIKGIANLAAVSGSTSQQASTAMYQLSQALAAGKVQLMDWNSVVNAGMGGQVFQDALKETARVNDIAIDDMIEKHGSFRETLQEGWLSAEILTQTLAKFTGDLSEAQLKEMGYSEEQIKEIIKLGQTANDAATKVKTFTQLMDTLKEAAQSGWTQTWEILIGDFEEAKKLWTGVSDYFSEALNKSAEARNSVLEGAMTSGWDQLLGKGIADEEGYKDSIKAIAKEHGVSIDDMIKAEKKLDGSLNDSEAFQKALASGLKDGSVTSDMLSKSVTKLADKMRGMSKAEREAAGYTDKHIYQIEQLESELKNGTISMEEFRQKIIQPSGRENIIQSFSNAFQGLLSVIKPIKEAFREIFPATTAKQLLEFTKKLKSFTANLKLGDKASEDLKNTFKGFFSLLDIGFIVIKDIVTAIGKLVGGTDGLAAKLLSVTGFLGKFVTGIRDSIRESGKFGSVLTTIATILKTVINKVGEFFKLIKDKITSLGFDGFRKVLQGIWNVLKAIGKAAAGIIADIVDGFKAAFENGDIGATALGGGFIAAIIMILTTIKKVFSGFNEFFGKFSDILDAVKDIFGTVGDALKSWQENLKAKTLLTIAGAIGILALSLVTLSTIDNAKLTSAIMAITVMFAELMGAMAIFSKIAGMVTGVAKASFAMVSMSISVLILSSALKKISDIKTEDLKKSLLGLLGVFVILLAAVTYMSKIDKVGKGSAKLINVAISLVIFASALKILATMSWGDIGRSLTAMAGVFTILIGSLKLLSMIDKVGKGTNKLFKIAVSLVVFASALKILATMSWEDIARSLTAMAGVFTILVATMAVMSKIKGAGKGVLSILVLANSLVIVGLALKIVGSMDWGGIARSLVGIGVTLGLMTVALAAVSAIGPKAIASAAAFVVLALAINMLVPSLVALGLISWENLAKGLIALTVAFGLMVAVGYAIKPVIGYVLAFSVALALVGVAFLAFGVGVSAVAMAVTTLAGAFSLSASAIVSGITTILMAGIKLIPMLTIALTEGLIGVLDVIAKSGKSIFGAVATITIALTEALTAAVPSIIEAVIVIVKNVAKALIELTPTLVDLIIRTTIQIIDGIRSKLPEFIGAVVEFTVAFTDQVIKAIPALLDAGVRLAIAITEGVTMTVPRLVDAAFKIIIKFLNGLADAIRINTPILIGALNNLLMASTEAAGMFIGNFTVIGGQLMAGLAKGIREGVSNVVKSVTGSVSTAWNAALNWLGIHSPSKKGIEAGRYIDEGLAVGLSKYSDVASNAATGVAKDTASSLSDALASVPDIMDSDVQPTIRPVLDLSDVKTGVNEIDDLFGFNPAISALANASGIDSSVGKNQNGAGDVISAIKELGRKVSENTGNVYNINGISYDDGTAVATAVESLVRAARIERRI